jgi:hypothetical protein
MSVLKSIRLCDYILATRGIHIEKVVDIICRLCKEDATGIHKLHCLRFLYDLLSAYAFTFCGKPSDCAAAWRYMLHTGMRSAGTVLLHSTCIADNNAALARIALNADPDLRDCLYADTLLSCTAYLRNPALVWLVAHLTAKSLWSLPNICRLSIQSAAARGHLVILQLLMHLQFEAYFAISNRFQKQCICVTLAYITFRS